MLKDLDWEMRTKGGERKKEIYLTSQYMNQVVLWNHSGIIFQPFETQKWSFIKGLGGLHASIVIHFYVYGKMLVNTLIRQT